MRAYFSFWATVNETRKDLRPKNESEYNPELELQLEHIHFVTAKNTFNTYIVFMIEKL